MREVFKHPFLIIALLIAIMFPLRFVHLDYSEFIPDEKKTVIRLMEDESVWDFLLNQRKGPLQFLIAEIPHRITGDWRNEFAQRLPFTIANILSIVIVYKLVSLMTKSRWAAVIVSVLFGVNGFIVGFGRIAQYQSLNMLFSFTSLLFLYYLTKSKDNLKKYALLAGIFTALSFLSHWDAVYYMPLSLVFIVKFLNRSDVIKQEKMEIIITGAVTFLIPFLLFFIPYIINITSTNAANLAYLGRRAGLQGSDLKEHFDIFLLYNPFITQYFYLVGFLLSLLFIKKTWPYVIWFLIDLALIKFFMVTPKTHIYNYVIPLLFCSGLGFYYFLNYIFNRNKLLSVFLTAPIILIIAFLYYQSYMLFVDHKPEYPWFEKRVWIFETKKFYSNQVLTFGFPYKRGWKEISNIIPPECTFVTNENKSIAQTYLLANYGPEGSCQYIITVKGTFNLEASAAIFPGLKKSSRVYQYRNFERVVTSVYKIR